MATSPDNNAGQEDRPDRLQIFWVKDGRPLPETLQDGNMRSEPYGELYAKALEQRSLGTTNEDVVHFYEFLSTFLIRNFNTTMYTDFHRMALEDADRGDQCGLHRLLSYYESLLSRETPLRDGLAKDMVQLILHYNDEARPLFQTLRAVWRDGKFNLKSRKKIDTVLTPDLRMELDK